MLYASLDGTAPCPVCGQVARLDLLSRWLISCVIALVLPIILLHGQVFYSGHLFFVSIVVVLGGWRILSFVGLPIFALETADGTAIDRRHSLWILAVLIAAAMIFDGFMSSRFEENP